MRIAAAGLVAAALIAGCGARTEVREPDVVVKGGVRRAADDRANPRSLEERRRIAVITHGQASSAFWTIVRSGIEAASRQVDVRVTYRAPDVFTLDSMRRLVDEAVDSRPDALVVSIPSPALAPSIRRAIAARIPVVSINSGSEVSRRLGALAHVGQPEEKAGFEAGRRLVAAGARNGVCVNQEVGNAGLDRRCAGFARALREAGGRSRVLAVSDLNVPVMRRRIALAASRPGVDAVLTLNSVAGEAAADVAPRGVALGTFDFSSAVLAAIKRGRIGFAVDQQPYLQGYLPIVLLAERLRYGLFPAAGELIPTGPSFVTRETADQVERLSRLGVR